MNIERIDQTNVELLRRAATECLGHQTLRAARALTRHYNAALRPVGLEATQFALLVAVRSRPDTSIAQISAALATEPSTLARNVAVLQRRGVLNADATRGRGGKRLRLTPEGEALHDRALPLWKAAYSAITDRLGRERSERALAVLRELETAAVSAQGGAICQTRHRSPAEGDR